MKTAKLFILSVILGAFSLGSCGGGYAKKRMDPLVGCGSSNMTQLDFPPQNFQQHMQQLQQMQQIQQMQQMRQEIVTLKKKNAKLNKLNNDEKKKNEITEMQKKVHELEIERKHNIILSDSLKNNDMKHDEKIKNLNDDHNDELEKKDDELKEKDGKLEKIKNEMEKIKKDLSDLNAERSKGNGKNNMIWAIRVFYFFFFLTIFGPFVEATLAVIGSRPVHFISSLSYYSSGYPWIISALLLFPGTMFEFFSSDKDLKDCFVPKYFCKFLKNIWNPFNGFIRGFLSKRNRRKLKHHRL